MLGILEELPPTASHPYLGKDGRAETKRRPGGSPLYAGGVQVCQILGEKIGAEEREKEGRKEEGKEGRKSHAQFSVLLHLV